MRDKLEKIIKAYEELEKKLSDPAVASDIKEFTRLNKEYAHQSDLIAASREYIGALDDIEAAKEMLHDTTDADEKEMLQMDISENEAKLPQLEEDIKYMLIPSDPNDDKNTIVEIRSAAGGDEAAIFAGDLYKMYQRFCESRGWKTTVLDSSPSEAGGFKSIEFKVEGDRVYSVMKFESGVHRVQRVPKTESQGRIQTSTATVAVLPEAEEIDVQINQSDLRIDTYCASGPGGQCVNTTYSAVRITHLPTNTVVQSQEQRSQIQNREVCMQMLRARLYEMELEKQQAELGAERQSQIGHGNRSEKIRTYNQPQDRVTDHRIGFNSTYNGVLLGDQLGTVIEALAAAERAEERRRQRVCDRAFHALAGQRGLQIHIPAGVHAIGKIDTVLFPEHLRRAETETRKEITRNILDIVVHIPLTCRDKLMVQADHITHRAHQLDVHIVVEIPYRIAPPLEFFLVRRGDAHHIGQLVHGFLALPQFGFQLIHTVQCFRN